MTEYMAVPKELLKLLTDNLQENNVGQHSRIHKQLFGIKSCNAWADENTLQDWLAIVQDSNQPMGNRLQMIDARIHAMLFGLKTSPWYKVSDGHKPITDGQLCAIYSSEHDTVWSAIWSMGNQEFVTPDGGWFELDEVDRYMELTKPIKE